MNKETVKELIFLYITKPLSFHKSNIRNNNVKLSKNQIKKLVKKIREINYLSNQIL